MKKLFWQTSLKAFVLLVSIAPAYAADPVPDIEHGDSEMVEHAGAAAHHAPGLPQMDPTWFPSQLFWLAVTFLCLYVVFARKVLPEISSTLETRRQQIQSDLDTAQDLKEEAESVHTAYEVILNDARKQSTELFVKTESAIKAHSEQKLKALRDDTVKKIAATEAEIDKAKKDALLDMHSIVAEVASAAAHKIVGVTTDLDQAKSVVKNIDKKAA